MFTVISLEGGVIRPDELDELDKMGQSGWDGSSEMFLTRRPEGVPSKMS